MLVEELLGYPLALSETTSVEMQDAVDDIILRARKGNVTNLSLLDLAGEISKVVGIYIDPTNEEFKQRLMDVLLQNDWVREVSPSGRIVIKTPDEFQPGQEEPGQEIEKSRDDQRNKVQKVAMKNVQNAGEEGL